jgi:2,4-didehydro-3-deoxy-L-rhamnonate hydrolase
MAIQTIRFRHQGSVRWGVVTAGGIAPLPGQYATTGEFLIRGAAAARALDLATAQASGLLSESEIAVLSPITANQQFICQALNYHQHVKESGIDPVTASANIIFTKSPSCLSSAREPVRKPSSVRLLDYEIELGLVVGRPITGPVAVRDENLGDFIAGVVITNDISARDLQIRQGQFYEGKSYRTFGPTGPYLCLLDPDDVPRLRDLQLCLRVNGALRQNGSTADMIHPPARTLSKLSEMQDLFPGDLIATGTPAGCALRAPSQLITSVWGLLPPRLRWNLFVVSQERSGRYLTAGDELEVTIRSRDGQLDLGVQRTVITDEAESPRAAAGDAQRAAAARGDDDFTAAVPETETSHLRPSPASR